MITVHFGCLSYLSFKSVILQLSLAYNFAYFSFNSSQWKMTPWSFCRKTSTMIQLYNYFNKAWSQRPVASHRIKSYDKAFITKQEAKSIYPNQCTTGHFPSSPVLFVHWHSLLLPDGSNYILWSFWLLPSKPRSGPWTQNYPRDGDLMFSFTVAMFLLASDIFRCEVNPKQTNFWTRAHFHLKG